MKNDTRMWIEWRNNEEEVHNWGVVGESNE